MPEQRRDGSQAQRWLDAQSVLVRQPTPEARARQRRSRNVRILVIIVVPIIASGLGLLWALSGYRLPLAGTFAPGPIRRTVGWALIAIGPILGIVGLVWMIRAREFRAAWRSPLINLTRKDRKLLATAIRRNQDPPQGQEQLAVYLASRMARQHPLLLVLGGVVAMDIGQGFTQDDPFFLWSTPVLVVLFVVAVVLVVRDIRAASRWLAAHTDQRSPSSPVDDSAR